jgi:predicted histone-like DNA-binding protein
MTIYYRLDKKTDNLNPENRKKDGLFPRVISKGTRHTEEFCRNAAKGTTFSPYELELALKIIFDNINSDLENGTSVCLDGIGTFSTTAEAARPVKEQHDIRAESVRVKKIVFKPSQVWMKKVKNWKFERLPPK